MATAIELLETLEDLGDRELKHFKWYLQQANFLKDFPPIPKSQLELRVSVFIDTGIRNRSDRREEEEITGATEGKETKGKDKIHSKDEGVQNRGQQISQDATGNVPTPLSHLSDLLKDFPPIPRSRLENADRPDTVDLMVQTYNHQCVEVAKKVLKKMRRNDLVESLSNPSSPGPEGTVITDGSDSREEVERTGATEGKETGEEDKIQSKDVGVKNRGQDATENVLTPLGHLSTVITDGSDRREEEETTGATEGKETEEEDIIHSKDEGVQNRGQQISQDATGNVPTPLSHLSIVEVEDVGETSEDTTASSVLLSDLPAVSWLTEDVMVPVLPLPQPNTSDPLTLQSDLQNMFKCAQGGWIEKQHEELSHDMNPELLITHIHTKLEMASGKQTETESPINPSDIFKHARSTHIRTVLTNGIAGMGKSVLVQKFLLDWAEKRANQDLHLIFPFSMRQLNLWSRESFCLAELIHTCIPETNFIEEETLNDLFTTLQNPRNSSFDQSEFKLLFVFDGLDESHVQLDLVGETKSFHDVTESTSVDVLLTNLIRGKLLPSARLWITTRPAAANQIPPECVDMT
ncbi:uncharacterized protein LOC118322559 [Morone saxatilis]|uniref:uncharacterized protein LOC118322559 n=1 Tax=Morone saxatilis TaxID=34816 RepID=UPI0015E2523E|nr:uncharacterized protein LOC118322559 [Morone saxatilis]